MVVGVWMGRNRRADAGVRPFLDAFQTIPPFVYLVPALALFGPTRFTAIVAAVAFGIPVATKLICRRHPRCVPDLGRGRHAPRAPRPGR